MNFIENNFQNFRDELKNSSRSCLISIHNKTNNTLYKY